eukprot:TRINITY_DN10774_c0_g1_i4.p1 TRINITY_DN10774_c0_g1~~TRINITY_DN10774_c0_g1_i4.p1  ORF type:complete len:1011 (-),score=200.62 TRINITY_DN10774_c0_g1_i4:412-3444(-)
MKKEPRIGQSGPKDIKQYPGCIRNILHLFDFGQDGGKNYLTDKTHSPRTEFSGSSVALEGYPDTHYGDEESAIGKKKKGVPMKTLIAEEMSKEMESKRHAPNVVARLMGLDTYPSEPMLAKHIQTPSEESKEELFGNHRSHVKGRSVLGKASSKSIPSASKDVSFPKSQRKPSRRKIKCNSPGSQDQPSRKKKNSHKKEEDSKATSFSDGYTTNHFDVLRMQLDEKRKLVQESLNEAKITTARKKLSDAKHLASDNLLQSKEFLQALAVLKSNKDLFLKFSEEPNSSFSKHLQDLEAPPSFSESEKFPKGRSRNVVPKDNLSQEEDAIGTKNANEHLVQDKYLHRQSIHQSSTQKIDPLPGLREQKLQCKGPDNAAKGDQSHPTRIVVLKPGPDSFQNGRHALSKASSFRAQTGPKTMNEGEKLTTRRFLEEIRERLRSGLKESNNQSFNFTKDNISAQSNDGPKNPKEIAKEIARQVRESVTRDLTRNYSKTDPTQKTNRDHAISLHGSGKSIGNGDRSWASDHYLTHTSPMSSESMINKEAKKRLSERLKLTYVNGKEHQSRRHADTLGKMLALREDANSKRQPKKPEHHINGSALSANYGFRSTVVDSELDPGFKDHTHETDKQSKPTEWKTIRETDAPLNTDCEIKEVHTIREEREGEQEDVKVVMYEQGHEEFMDAEKIKGSSCISTSNSLEFSPSAQKNLLTFIDTSFSGNEVNLEEGQSTSSTCSSSPKQVPCVDRKSLVTDSEKAEHSSPVSVLDSPFQREENLSPPCFKEINTDLQENDGLDSDTNECPQADTTRCSSPSSAVSLLSRSSFCIKDVDFDSLPLDDLQCPHERIWALQYLRMILVTSGFSRGVFFVSWHSPYQPLDPSLCNEMERFLDIDGNDADTYHTKWDHILLFDCINEVLFKILGPFLNHRPWAKDKIMESRRMPSSKQLLKETWAEISYHLDTEWQGNNILEIIVARDFNKERPWLDLRNDTEAIGCEIEKNLTNVLIEELICDLLW